MKNTPLWRGSKEMQEDPSSPTFERTKEGDKYTRVFNGPYSKLMANIPQRFAAMADMPDSVSVDTVRLQKAPGGRGVLTITLSPTPQQGVDAPPTPEIEWIEVQKKLETHPMFNPTSVWSTHPNAGKYPLDDADLDIIDRWKNAATPYERIAVYQNILGYTDGVYYPEAVFPEAKQFVDRLRRGQDSYVCYVPHCRLTTKNSTPPTHSYCGYPDTPPESVKVPGFVYLLTSDRGQRDQTWTRVKEWTGCDFIDHEVYARNV